MKKKEGGYIALISVIVIGAIASSVGISSIVLGTVSSNTTFSRQSGEQATSLADACVEQALENIKNSPNYIGTTNIDPIGFGSCSYSVLNTGGSTREIQATGVVSDSTRKIEVILSSNLPIIIDSWLSVTDF